MTKIGVIGLGVVGKAMYDACAQQGFEMVGYDPFKDEFKDRKALLACDMIFTCTPTPTNDNWVQDKSTLLENLIFLATRGYAGIVVVKSTVLPGTVKQMSQEFPKLRLCHNPEFLTAARPLEDLLDQPSILIGGKDAMEVADFYRKWSKVPPIFCYDDTTVTETAKYTHNCFLSVKVGFMNEIYDLCQKVGVSYNEMLEGALSIGGIGKGHTMVPGPDGGRGFSGMCFPKDTKALAKFAMDGKLDMDVLITTIYANKRRRGE